MSTETDRLIEWFSENTLVVSVDSAIQAKDRFNIGERTRTKERAAFLLAQRLIDAGLVATTVIRTLQGDILRVQVQGVRPEVWCPTHSQVFEVTEVPHATATPANDEHSQYDTQ